MNAWSTTPNVEPYRGPLIAVCVVTLTVLVVHARCSRDDEGGAKVAHPTATPLVPPAVPPAISAQSASDEEGSDPTDDTLDRLLLVGFDRADGEIGRTDAILIVVLDHDSGEVGVISVPRDLWVDIPGHEPGRINSVVRIGERFGGPGGGLALLERVLDEQLGLPVSAAVAVSFEGFTEIIDGLGGIDVDVRCPIEDNFISPSTESGYEHLSLAAGEQRLDGHTALLYSRSRHGRSDTDRSYRQQAVLLGIKKRILRPGALSRLPRLWRTLAAHAVTDLDLSQALSLATFVASANSHALHGLVLAPPVLTEARSEDGKWILLLDREKLDNAVAHLFDAPLPGVRGRAPCPPSDVALHWKQVSQAP